MNAAATFAVGAGALGIVGGLAAGVLAERSTRGPLEQRKNEVAAEAQHRNEWLASATDHFANDIERDRLTSRDFDARIEDYMLENPAPEGASIGRIGKWNPVAYPPAGAERNELWLSTIGGGLGAGVIGATTLGIGYEARAVPASAIGAAILGISAGALLGSVLSSLDD